MILTYYPAEEQVTAQNKQKPALLIPISEGATHIEYLAFNYNIRNNEIYEIYVYFAQRKEY